MTNREAIEAVRQILDSVRYEDGRLPRIVRNGVREMVDSDFKDRMDKAREILRKCLEDF